MSGHPKSLLVTPPPDSRCTEIALVTASGQPTVSLVISPTLCRWYRNRVTSGAPGENVRGGGGVGKVWLGLTTVRWAAPRVSMKTWISGEIVPPLAMVANGAGSMVTEPSTGQGMPLQLPTTPSVQTQLCSHPERSTTS